MKNERRLRDLPPSHLLLLQVHVVWITYRQCTANLPVQLQSSMQFIHPLYKVTAAVGHRMGDFKRDQQQ